MTDSSDDRSEYWNISTRSGRKCRGRRGRACPGFLKACSAFLACASILATASLIWLFIDVRQQLTALRTELDQGTGLAFPKNDSTFVRLRSSNKKKEISNRKHERRNMENGEKEYIYLFIYLLIYVHKYLIHEK